MFESRLRAPHALAALLLFPGACASSVATPPAAAAPAVSASVVEARALFERFLVLNAAFDPAAADFYADSANVHTMRTGAEGQTKEFALTGAQWKPIVQANMPSAQKRADVSEFSNVQVAELEAGVKISAHRYTPRRCQHDPGYFVITARDASGAMRIIEESSTTHSESACGLGEGKTLAQRLDELRTQVLPLLPMLLDEETRFESLAHDGHDLKYTFTLLNLSAAEFPNFAQQMGELARKNACEPPAMQAVFAAGGTVTYVYQDGAQQTSLPFTFDAARCATQG